MLCQQDWSVRPVEVAQLAGNGPESTQPKLPTEAHQVPNLDTCVDVNEIEPQVSDLVMIKKSSCELGESACDARDPWGERAGDGTQPSSFPPYERHVSGQLVKSTGSEGRVVRIRNRIRPMGRTSESRYGL